MRWLMWSDKRTDENEEKTKKENKTETKRKFYQHIAKHPMVKLEQKRHCYQKRAVVVVAAAVFFLFVVDHIT